MPAVSLQDAASQAYGLIAAQWEAGTLQVAFAGFNADVATVFPSQGGDNTAPERTVSNWLVSGKSIENDIPMGPAMASYLTVNQASQYVFQICWAADDASTSVPLRITVAQAAAILAAFNANF